MSESINNSPLRIGAFTSSEIFNLCAEGKAKGSIGDPYFTYIEEKNMENRLGLPLSTEQNAKSLTWGKLCESYVFSQPDLLSTSYRQCSQVTIVHPETPKWVGSPDGSNGEPPEKTEFDLKCPITRKSFCQLVDPFYDGLKGMEAMNALRFGYTDSRGFVHKKHKEGEKYYYQIVSNAILDNAKYGELIVFMPYQRELEAIKEFAREQQDITNPVYWIVNALDDELPFIVEGGFYKNLNVIQFEIPQSDKDFLTQRVISAIKLLQK